MQEPVHPLIDQERFIRELLTLYKEYPELWDKNNPHYRNRMKRNSATEILVQKCQEYYPEADEDFVKLKIDSLRACFRKEWNKVCRSKATAERPEDVHKPALWYYNLLLYTVGEDCQEDVIYNDGARIFWNREYSVILINLFKQYPCLYGSESTRATLTKRNAAFRKITEEINALTGKLFTVDDIKKKIQLLKGQYRHECRKFQKNRSRKLRESYKTTLWCFDMLHFLKGHVFKKGISPKQRRRRNQLNEESSHSEEDLQDIKEETDTEQYEDDYNQNYADNISSTVALDNEIEDDDIYDTIGKNVAHKLRDMSDEQQKLAEKLINELMYHGQMEDLTVNSRLSIDGT